MDSSGLNLFWQWFTANERPIFALESVSQSSELLEQLALRLQQIDENLSFEIGPVVDGIREFVLSASGVRQSFSLVTDLLSCAPSSENFTFIAFRQRKPLDGLELQLGHLRVKPQDISIFMRQELRRVDLTLFVEDYCEEDYYAWMNVAFILLDTVVGEFDVACKIGEVEVTSKANSGALETFNMDQLAERFDNLIQSERTTLAKFDKLPKKQREGRLIQRLISTTKQRLKVLYLSDGDKIERICLECYFRPIKEKYSEEFLAFLDNLHDSAVTSVEMGGLDGVRTWILFSLELPVIELDAMDAIIASLAERGFSYRCELEQIYVSEVMDGSEILGLLSGIKLPSASLSALQAQQQIETGNISEACETLEDALEEYPGDFELRGLLSYTYAKLGSIEEAENLLEELTDELVVSEDNAATYWNIACCYAILQQRDDACRFLEVALNLNPSLRESVTSDPDLSVLAGTPEFDRLHTLQ